MSQTIDIAKLKAENAALDAALAGEVAENAKLRAALSELVKDVERNQLPHSPWHLKAAKAALAGEVSRDE